MCSYNIAIEDSVMAEVRPSIDKNMDEAVWVQLQVEALFHRLATRSAAKKKVPLTRKLRGIGTAPAGFDYKKELESRFG